MGIAIARGSYPNYNNLGSLLNPLPGLFVGNGVHNSTGTGMIAGRSGTVTLAAGASSTVITFSNSVWSSDPAGWFLIYSPTSSSGATTEIGRALYFVAARNNGSATPFIESIFAVQSVSASASTNILQITNGGTVTRTLFWNWFPLL